VGLGGCRSTHPMADPIPPHPIVVVNACPAPWHPHTHLEAEPPSSESHCSRSFCCCRFVPTLRNSRCWRDRYLQRRANSGVSELLELFISTPADGRAQERALHHSLLNAQDSNSPREPQPGIHVSMHERGHPRLVGQGV